MSIFPELRILQQMPLRFGRQRSLFLFVQLSAAIWTVYLWYHTPQPGWAVAILAVIAAAMSFDTNTRTWQKAAWMLLAVAFLRVELRAITLNRTQSENGEVQRRVEQNHQFERVLKEQQAGFSQSLRQQEIGFATSLKSQLDARAEERIRFGSILSQGEQVFQHQQDLAESLREKLIPGNQPTPVNSCDRVMRRKADDLVILSGTQAFIAVTFPHTILAVGETKVLQVDRSPDGAITLLGDIRGQDNRIIARFDRDGILVNQANKLAVVKTKNSISIVDQTGNEVLNAELLNRTTFRIDALLFHNGHPILLSNPVNGRVFSGICLQSSGPGADIHISVESSGLQPLR